MPSRRSVLGRARSNKPVAGAVAGVAVAIGIAAAGAAVGGGNRQAAVLHPSPASLARACPSWHRRAGAALPLDTRFWYRSLVIDGSTLHNRFRRLSSAVSLADACRCGRLRL